MKNTIVVATFFCLWLSTQLSPQLQDYLAYGLILTFGVLHGANDITLITSLNIDKQPLKNILVKYIGVILLVTAVFLFSKSVMLLVFIVISGYHFGEQHFNSNLTEETKLKTPLFLAYGLTILFMIFTIKLNSVIPILKDVAGLELNTETFIALLVFFSILFAALFAFLIWKGTLKVNLIREVFSLLVLTIVFYNASLVWGFCIYFVLWHSIPSLHDQIVVLYGETTANSFRKYLRTSWLYWLVSIVGLVVLYVLLRNSVDYFITVVLYVLAAITFPHVIVMSKVESLKNSLGK